MELKQKIKAYTQKKNDVGSRAPRTFLICELPVILHCAISIRMLDCTILMISRSFGQAGSFISARSSEELPFGQKMALFCRLPRKQSNCTVSIASSATIGCQLNRMLSFLPVFTSHSSAVHDSLHEHERVFLLVKQTKTTIEASIREATFNNQTKNRHKSNNND